MPIEIIPEPAPRGDGRFDSDEYVSSVRRTLAVIRGSRVGQAVMRHLWTRLEIRPWTGGGRNASALPLQRPNALPRGRRDRYDGDIRFERRWLAKLQREMPTLVGELARIPRFVASRNPFADARYEQYDTIPARSPQPRTERVPLHRAFLLDPRPYR
ncbi:MAG: hypothetical protein SangKO_048180 [Sandaracinaceae bacterium]